MPSFSHIVGFALVAFSLGYAVSAMPTVSNVDVSIPECIGSDPVSHLFSSLRLEIEAKLKAILGCATMVELAIAIDAFIAVLTTCVDALVKIGAGVKVAADAQASIASCVVAIITVLVKICIQVSAKFGVAAVAVLVAKLDVVCQLLLVNLNICIGGIITIVAKALAHTTIGLLAQLQLKLCLSVLAMAGVGL